MLELIQGRVAALVAIMAGPILFGAPFHAQVAQAALEEITVTTNKRDESLQDVPVSVGVVSGEIVTDLDIQDLTDLQAFIPSFTVQSTFGNWSVRIRGVGSGQTNLAFASSVSIFNDEVYCGRSRCLEGGFLDVERVEVARGPQGALFGRSTIAGAVSVISAKPTEEFEGYVRGAYEFENDGYNATGVVSGPFTDSLRGRLAVKSEKVGGYIKNTFDGSDEPEIDKFAIRGSLAWDATDDLLFNLKIEHAIKDEDGNPNQLANPGLFGMLTADPNAEFNVDDVRHVSTGTGIPGFDDMDTTMAVLTMDATLGEHMLTAIAAHWELDYENYLDLDGVPEAFLAGGLSEDYDQQSLEVRLLSPEGQTLEYIAGVLYHKSDTRTRQRSLYGFLPVPYWQDRNYQSDSDMWSVFGQLTWNITDDLRLIADARYTDEEQDGTAWGLFPLASDPNQQSASPAEFRMSQKREDENFDPSIRIQYDLTDDIMVYGAYATGSKPGGMRSNDGNIGNQLLAVGDPAFYQTFLGQPTVTPAEVAAGVTLAQGNGVLDFEEEDADSFEIGAKMMFADGRASLNVALFSMDFDDLQTSSYDGTAFVITNAASAGIEGIEIEGSWQVVDALSLYGSMSWLDAEYDNFIGGQCLVADAAGNFQDPTCVDGFEDLSGTKLERTPDYEITLTADYEQPITNSLLLRGLVSMYYSDELSIRQDFHPLGIQDSYTKWDVRAGLASVDETWEVAVVGRNLGDEKTINHAYEIAGSNFVALGNGRTVSLEGTWRF